MPTRSSSTSIVSTLVDDIHVEAFPALARYAGQMATFTVQEGGAVLVGVNAASPITARGNEAYALAGALAEAAAASARRASARAPAPAASITTSNRFLGIPDAGDDGDGAPAGALAAAPAAGSGSFNVVVSKANKKAMKREAHWMGVALAHVDRVAQQRLGAALQQWRDAAGAIREARAQRAEAEKQLEIERRLHAAFAKGKAAAELTAQAEFFRRGLYLRRLARAAARSAALDESDGEEAPPQPVGKSGARATPQPRAAKPPAPRTKPKAAKLDAFGSFLVDAGLQRIDPELRAIGIVGEKILNRAMLDEVVQALDERDVTLSSWERRSLEPLTLSGPPTREYAFEPAAATPPRRAPAPARASAPTQAGAPLAQPGEELALAHLVLSGVPLGEKVLAGRAWLGALGPALANTAPSAGTVDLEPADDEVFENLQMLLEIALARGLVDQIELEPQRSGLSGARMHAKRLAANVRESGTAPTAPEAGEPLVDDDGVSELARMHRQLLNAKHGDASQPRAVGQKRLLQLGAIKGAVKALDKLNAAAADGKLTSDMCLAACREFPQLCEVLKHEKVICPGGASLPLERVWEHVGLVQHAWKQCLARDICSLLPDDADGTPIAHAALFGKLDDFKLTDVLHPTKTAGLLGSAPKKSGATGSDASAEEGSVMSVMPAMERALKAASPHDETVEATLQIIRSALEKVQAGGLTERQAVLGILVPFLSQYAKKTTDFLHGLPLPRMESVWKETSALPAVSKVLKEQGSGGASGERVEKLEKELAKAVAAVEKLEKALKSANSRIDELAQLGKKRWVALGGPELNDAEQPGGGRGKGAGGGKGKGGRGGGAAQPKPDAKPDDEA